MNAGLRIAALNERIAKGNRVIETNGREYFKTGDGLYFCLTEVKEPEAVVVEYAESVRELEGLMLDSGELFPLTMDEDEMFDRIQEEIRNR